jgi:hypothetical protein
MPYYLTKEQWIYIKQDQSATSFIPTQSRPVTTKTRKEAHGSTTTSSHGISWRAKIHGRLSGPPKNKAWKQRVIFHLVSKKRWRNSTIDQSAPWTSLMQGQSHLLGWERCHEQRLIHQLYTPVSKPNQSTMQPCKMNTEQCKKKRLNSTRHATYQHHPLNSFSKLPFTNTDVWIMVGTSCRRTAASKLCIAERWKCSSYPSYQKWKRQCWPRVLPSNGSNKDIHPSSNRRANTWKIT